MEDGSKASVACGNFSLRQAEAQAFWSVVGVLQKSVLGRFACAYSIVDQGLSQFEVEPLNLFRGRTSLWLRWIQIDFYGCKLIYMDSY